MAANQVNQAFLQFQKDGDPEALARVFDGTAIDLLQIASHLVSSVEDAEDLVQATYLVAIEETASYDPTKGSVASWLFGILKNRCHKSLRAQRRVIDAERIVRPEIREPGSLLEERELVV